jgi:hypothetical protein
MNKNFIKKHWLKLISLSYLLLTPHFALNAATGTCDPAGGKLCNPLGDTATDVPTFIKTLLTGLLQIGIPIVALAVIYSGFLFVEARGNSEKLTKAKDALLYTLIGAAILLGSWAIAQMISATVGVVAS